MLSARPPKSLQGLFKGSFDPLTKSRGKVYFYQGRVNSVMAEPRKLSGKVQGENLYSVELAINPSASDELCASCSCPYFEDGFFCKHVWAFILDVDRRGLVEKKMPIHKQMSLVHGLQNHKVEIESDQDHPERIDISDEGIVFDEDRVPSAPASQQAPPHRAVTSKAPITWRDRLSILHETDGPAGTNSPLRSEPKLRSKLFFVIEKHRRMPNLATVKIYIAIPNSGPLAIHAVHMEHAKAVAKHDPIMADVLALILSLTNLQMERDIQIHSLNRSEFSFTASEMQILLKNLLATERVYLSPEDFLKQEESGQTQCLRLAYFRDYKLSVVDSGSDYQVEGRVIVSPQLQGATTALAKFSDLKILAEPNLILWENSIGVLDLPAHDVQLLNDFERDPVVVPRPEVNQLMEFVFDAGAEVEWPEDLRWREERVVPTARINLFKDAQTAKGHGGFKQERLMIEMLFRYEGYEVKYGEGGKVIALPKEKIVYFRQLELEKDLYNKTVRALAVPSTLYGDDQPQLLVKNLPAFVQVALAHNILVSVDNKEISQAVNFRFDVQSGVDWFDMDAQIQFGSQWVRVPDILDAIKKGEVFVPLPGGSYGMMNADDLKRIEKIIQFADQQGDRLRFKKSQGLLLGTILEGEANVTSDQGYAEFAKKIREFNGIKLREPSETFKGELRKYQSEGLSWLMFLKEFGLGGVLADDMGLGKTIQCLAFLELDRNLKNKLSKTDKGQTPRPSLIVAPKSLLENWQLEAKKFTPKMKVFIHSGVERDRTLKSFDKYDLIITTYHTLLRDIDLLQEFQWRNVIIDEAQAIKNARAQISQAVKVLTADFRLAMTGTPIENSIQDLFSISEFVNPGFLSGKKSNLNLKIDDETRSLLAKTFKPVILRRTKGEVLKDLPDKIEQTITVELEEKQKKVYDELKRYYQTQLVSEIKTVGIKKSKIKILAALTRLRQAALHPGLIDSDLTNEPSAKLLQLFEMLTELISEGHKVLVFSQFTSYLAIVRRTLDERAIKYCYLDGKTKDRQKVVDEFKGEDIPVFLISLKAGGVGLNLIDADYVFLLDPWWNPAVEAQAIDRTHRIGQKRTVNAYRLIAKGTVEEKILELQKTKKGLAADIISQDDAIIKNLTAGDIEHLFD